MLTIGIVPKIFLEIPKLKIAVASDHAAFEFRDELITYLKEQGHEITDFGCPNTDSCDYPDFGILAAKEVSEQRADRAILCCNNGIGMSMLANKFDGIAAALVYSNITAQMTREHHDSNVLCLGAQHFTKEELLSFVKIWLNTEFSGGRHLRRIGKVHDIKNNQ